MMFSLLFGREGKTVQVLRGSDGVANWVMVEPRVEVRHRDKESSRVSV
jgi:hypothetical protein